MKRELLAATAIGSLAFVWTDGAHGQVFNWSGSYIGGFVGFGHGNSRSLGFQPLGPAAYDLNFPADVPTFNPVSPAAGVSTGPFSALPFGNVGANGLLVGGTLGYNYQVDRFVFGVETDFASYRTSVYGSSIQQNIGANGARITTASVTAGTDWLYMLRARIGYAQDRLLVFGTAGLALGGTRLGGAFGINENNLGFTPALGAVIPGKGTTVSTSALGGAFGSRRDIRAGFVVGGGAEYAITDHLTIKLEGLYYDLGTMSTMLGGIGGYQAISVVNPIFTPPTTTASGGAFSIQPLAVRTRFDGALARLGVNYKF